MNRFRTSLPLMVLFMAIASNALASNTWYVNGVNGSDTNNCLAAQTACKTIGHAISLASSGDSVIVAAATYTENLTIGINLTLLGSGDTTTIIDGRGVAITISSTTAHVNLSKLKIQNGAALCGDGVYNVGTLAISSTVISGNHTATRYPLAGGGGGICNHGATTISNSTISGNEAGGTIERFVQGGGVLNSGTLTINSSTISGNSLHLGAGGGIANNGKMTINDSTISGNNGFLRGGGIYSTDTTATTSINNSTIASNTTNFSTHGQPGGVDVLYGTLTIQSSIVASNSGANCSGALSSKGYNLSSDGSCSFNHTGDLNNHDPLLGPLQTTADQQKQWHCSKEAQRLMRATRVAALTARVTY